jgi:hypothetical protein
LGLFHFLRYAMSQHEQAPIPAAPDFLSGGGEMGALIRSIDWSATPIGAAESWTPALCMMVRLLLANRFPLLLWWGPQYCQIYNDAYRPVLGSRWDNGRVNASRRSGPLSAR